MSLFQQALEELRDEMEARAIEALALAQVQPDASEKWAAQARALTLAWGSLDFAARAEGSYLVREAVVTRCFRFRLEHAEQVAALVEKRREERSHA